MRGAGAALAERQDVPHVRAAPLVDRLVVVADDGELHRRRGEQLDEALLGRVDVLVLVDEQVAQRAVDAREDLGSFKRLERAGDEQAEGEEVVPVEHLAVGRVARRRAGCRRARPRGSARCR